LQGALQIYLQYPQRYPQNPSLRDPVLCERTETWPEALGDSNSGQPRVRRITITRRQFRITSWCSTYAATLCCRATPHLGGAFSGKRGLSLARQMLAQHNGSGSARADRVRVLRRLCDFDQHQRTLDYSPRMPPTFQDPMPTRIPTTIIFSATFTSARSLWDHQSGKCNHSNGRAA